MTSHRHIHVIDPDFRRRARITFALAHRNLHAEIYEDLEEFASRVPTEERFSSPTNRAAAVPAR